MFPPLPVRSHTHTRSSYLCELARREEIKPPKPPKPPKAVGVLPLGCRRRLSMALRPNLN